MLLLDNSAWSHLGQDRLDDRRLEAVAEWMSRGEVGVCLPFLLEAGYSARPGVEHRTMMVDLGRLPRVAIDAEVEALALAAQRQLAEVGHHRLPPADAIIAACAHRAEAGVLHYDGDYDVLAEHTELDFESVWLAPAGAL